MISYPDSWDDLNNTTSLRAGPDPKQRSTEPTDENCIQREAGGIESIGFEAPFLARIGCAEAELTAAGSLRPQEPRCAQ